MKLNLNLSLLKKISLLILIVPFLFSCEDEIDAKLGEGKSLLVVDGWITDQPGPHIVKLSTTAPYFSNSPAPRVSHAEVSISDTEGHIITLTEIEPGIYETPASFRGRVGYTYALHINVNGDRYEAHTEIRRPAVIDSLSQKYREASMNWQEGYYVLYNGQDHAGLGDFFRFKLYVNDTLQNKPENLLISTDRFYDGKYLHGVELHRKPLRKGDHVRVESWSITEYAYLYYIEMLAQIKNGGLFANVPANVRSNIMPVGSGNSREATGYFGGASIASKEHTIR
jgi:hypothetical protein